MNVWRAYSLTLTGLLAAYSVWGYRIGKILLADLRASQVDRWQ